MISKTASHATLALVVMSRLKTGEFVGAAQIAREIAAPQNYLGKLLKLLAGKGLLESQKGFGGGFRLARNPRQISLFDVVEPIDKVSRWGNCFLGNGSCNPDSPCAVHNRWKKIRQDYLKFLHETTIASLGDSRDMKARFG